MYHNSIPYKKNFAWKIFMRFLLFLYFIFFSINFAQVSNTSLLFDGIVDKVDCGNNELLTPQNSITLSVWIKTIEAGTGQTIIWRGDVVENYYGIKIADGQKVRGTLFLNNFTHIYSNTIIQSNVWYHIAFTYDNHLSNNNFKLYINGQLDNVITGYGSIRWDSNPFLIGYYPWSNPFVFKGYIQNIQVWNRALSQQEIQQKMYQSLSPSQEQGLVAYWPANEGQGNILHDVSGNHIDGYIYGAEWSPNNSLQASITSDNIWIDDDYDGTAINRVSGSTSTGNIISYTWTVDLDTIATGINPVVTIPTGSHLLSLIVRNDLDVQSKDSILVSVYAAKMNTNGAIYSAVSQLNENCYFISSSDDRVYQFDSLGKAKWTYLTGGDIQSTITVSDEKNIFVTSTDTRLYSFNNLGVPNWDKALGGIIVSSPTIFKDHSILVGMTTGRLFALNYNGDIKWSFQADGEIVSSPVVDSDGNIYFGCKDKKLYALLQNGNLLWTYLTLDSIISPPALGLDSSVIIGSMDGYIYKIKNNGELIWKFNTVGAIYSAPIIGEDGQVFVGSTSGFFYSISKDGNLIWKYFANSRIKSTASISPDGSTIYVGTESGKILALSKEGKLKWYLQTNGAISAPTLITRNNLLMVGNADGVIFIMKERPSGLRKQAKSVKLEWPTFLGNNRRTGDQITTLTGVKKKEVTIDRFLLMQNYPNPFNPNTTIVYTIPSACLVKITIYSSLGETIQDFNLGIQSPGNYKWDFNGMKLSSGIYFYSFQAFPADGSKEFRSVKKLSLVK
jgi:hypothetical protein